VPVERIHRPDSHEWVQRTKIYLKRKTLGVNCTCVRFGWSTGTVWAVEIWKQTYHCSLASSALWTTTATTKRERKRERERVWRITRKEEERKERVGTAKDRESIPVEWEREGEISVWEREWDYRPSDRRGNTCPGTDTDAHRQAHGCLPTARMNSLTPLSLSLFSCSPSFNHSTHSLPTLYSSFLGAAGFCMIALPFFLSTSVLRYISLPTFFPPLVLLINTQLERTGKNQC